MDEELLHEPFDARSLLDLVDHAVEKNLPAANFSLKLKKTWNGNNRALSDRHKRIATELLFRVERDLSEIEIQIDFGNILPRKSDGERALKHALSHLPAAVSRMMAAREEVKIHASTVGMIMISGDPSQNMPRGLPAFEQFLRFAARRRTCVRITPYGVNFREDNDGLTWQVEWPRIQLMRLPGKRILPDAFKVGDLLVHNDRVNLYKPLPETVMSDHRGKPLTDLIDLPGFHLIKTRIKEFDQRPGGAVVHYTSPTINLEEASELAARIHEIVGK